MLDSKISMNNKYLPFARPDIGEEEINEVIDSLQSGWITTGPKTKKFETDFSEFIGSNVEAISVNSATAGMHLALESIGIKANDEVIVPSYTFTATAEVVRYLGAHPVFVDIEPDTLNIDPEKILQAITGRTRAIIPVHFGGLACDMEKIIKIAKDNNLKIIEDAAHALPTTYSKKLIGSLDTDATVYSFYATKTITTGEGGMIVTKDSKIADRCRLMRLHGISCDAYNRYSKDNPNWYYEVIAPGFKYNMTDIAASMGIHQLHKVWKLQQKREHIANLYNHELKTLPLTLPATAFQEDKHAWHLYVIRLNEEVTVGRDEVIQQLLDRGIGCSVHFIPLHIQPFWKNEYQLEPEACPVSLREYKRAISLPIYSMMTDEDTFRVINELKNIIS